MENIENPLSLLAVVGPTASGKTRLGVELALALDGEIVSADSMQIYTGMDVATAKPTAAEMRGVPHHLIGFVEPDEAYSVARFVSDASSTIDDILARNKRPILVGGTGLYLSSLIDGIRFSEQRQDPALRAKLLEQAELVGNEEMHRQLCRIDPEYAALLHPNNRGRVLRALELFETSGVTMTAQLAASRTVPSRYAPVLLGLDYLDRDKLYERIDLRVDQMLSDGLLDEARQFYQSHGAKKTAAQAIGCKELQPYLAGTAPLEQCVETLKRETRRYAKRQLTWFRRDKRIHWLFCDQYDNFDALLQDALCLALAAK